MLNVLFHSFFFKKNVKTGLFIDYFFRKKSIIFIKNNFIWAGLFLLEKFFIEYISKGVYSNLFNFVLKKNNNFLDLFLIINFIFLLFLFLLFI